MPRHLSVLIVDDDPSIAALLAELVATSGAAVWGVAVSGEAALESLLAAAGSGRPGLGSVPDLVLLDVYLPGIDGIETCRRLRRMYPSVRVVLISSDPLADLPADSLDGGADRFVPKALLGPDVVGSLLAG